MNNGSPLLLVEEQNFEEQVVQSPVPIVVEFGAEWCRPCRALEPVYEKLSREYMGTVRFARMDADESPAVTARLGIQAVPTLIVFKDGVMIGRMVGPHPARLKQSLERLLAEV